MEVFEVTIHAFGAGVLIVLLKRHLAVVMLAVRAVTLPGYSTLSPPTVHRTWCRLVSQVGQGMPLVCVWLCAPAAFHGSA